MGPKPAVRLKLNWTARAWGVFALAALVLVGLALQHRIPMMLWDHSDLVPLYRAWQEGQLTLADLFAVHDGSHFHTSAYVILLLTTRLSAGQAWLDVLASGALLSLQAWLLLQISVRSLPEVGSGRGWWYVLVLLALYPGHLSNLQWGWQVAVFVSSLGAVLTIFLLTRAHVCHFSNLAALSAATVGCFGFSCTLAVFPVAIALLFSQTSLRLRTRFTLSLPWLIVAALFVAGLGEAGQSTPTSPGKTLLLLHYALNYLGAGIARFAGDLSPVVAVIALATVAWAWLRASATASLQAIRPWLALMGFAVGCAGLTALGRAAAFGSEHAFVGRYVSYSSLFWFGWLGLMLSTELAQRRGRFVVSVVLLLASINALHMVKKAAHTGAKTRAYAEQISQQYPNIDPALLHDAFLDRAGSAAERLRWLHALGFAPFKAPAKEDQVGKANQRREDAAQISPNE